MPLQQVFQSSITAFQPLGYEGEVATATWASIRGCLRKLYNRTGLILPFGRAVILQPGFRDRIQLPGQTISNTAYTYTTTSSTSSSSSTSPAPGYSFVGVAIYNEFFSTQPYTAFDQNNQNYVAGYQPNTQCSVLTKGGADVYVITETPVQAGDNAYVRVGLESGITDPLLGGLGRFSNYVGVATSANWTIWNGAQFVHSAGAGELVALNIGGF